jgi:hypothetical protein
MSQTELFTISGSLPSYTEDAAPVGHGSGPRPTKWVSVNRRRKVGQDRRRKVCHTVGCIWPVVHRVHRGDPPPLRSAFALARSGGGGE